MLKYKHTALAALMLVHNAFAGTMGTHDCLVNVPCNTSAWSFAGQALYLNPTLDNNALSTMYQIEPNGTNDFLSFQPGYGWGFKVEGAYHFGQGKDINLNWYNLNNGYQQSFENVDDAIIDGYITGASGTVYNHPNWNAANAELGQKIDLGELTHVRLYGGVQYARIANNRQINALPTAFIPGRTPATGVITESEITQNTTYNGFGPRIGANFGYDLEYGFHVYGDLGTTLLIGTKKYFASWVSPVGFQTAEYQASYGSLVPELEAKLGATFNYDARALGEFSLDAGWMWVNYFNPQMFIKIVTPSNPQLAVTFDINEANFGLQGPYVGLKWLGNII